jgi:hypothetical protein
MKENDLELIVVSNNSSKRSVNFVVVVHAL